MWSKKTFNQKYKIGKKCNKQLLEKALKKIPAFGKVPKKVASYHMY